MTLSDVLATATQRLQAAGIDNPSFDARLLIGTALNLDRAQMLARARDGVSAEQHAHIKKLIARREVREPVARILGMREFWGLPFALNEATLEPRPDSETLIETTLKPLADRKTERLRLLDLGTGTGCLLLSLLHELPNASGLGIDLAPRAVEQAVQNAATLGLEKRASFRTGNWLDGIDETFDIIVSNPPYIRTDEIPALMPEVRDHDPRAAHDGGADGLAPYRHLIPQLKNFLNPNGFAIFEVGHDQAQQVAALFAQNSFQNIEIHEDLSGNDRCISAFV
ncbi:MAG: peptide chain release factor N(5)-glutamine methyltransferase [Alphaproteobacteria bacterium]|nr:peptide chain release factor N(5)-glutamine methyltransferase [Alphaproteobacteria bacterium]